MKKQFSRAWKASIQPRKQRKYRANAPFHLKQRLLSAHLSKDLREKYNRRSFGIRKGDTVKIMTGENKNKTGKIISANLIKNRVDIDGLQITKKDGSKTNLHFSPSNLMITELNLDDKRRMESLTKENKIKIKPEKK